MAARSRSSRRARSRAAASAVSEHHLELLRAHGVAPEVARERGYRSVASARALAALDFSPEQRLAPALVAPVRGPTGRVVHRRIRPDTPRVRFGVPIAEESPRGRARVLDVPPRVRPRLRDRSVALHVRADGSPLAVDAAVSRGLCCIGIDGASGWRNRRGAPLAEWSAIALDGREVHIALDDPRAARPHARPAIAALAVFLRSRGAQVHVDASFATKGQGGGALPSRLADALIAIGTRAELFHDERNEPYAVVQNGVARRAVRVRGRDFRMWLRHELYRGTKNGAADAQLSGAIEVLAAKAVFDGTKRSVPLRFSGAPPEAWVDLADDAGRAVRVTPRGFGVVAAPKVLFRRFSHQLALPVPARRGSLDDLRPFLNVARDEDVLLVHAWLVAAMLSHVPCPALCFFGPQGSAKTTQARLLRSLLDPSSVPSLELGQSASELAQNLDHHAVPLFDNLSRLNQRQADFLCRAVTGGGFSKRELFSNDDDVLFSFRRPMLLTGVNVPALQPDLLDRLLLVELRAIPPERRRPEQELQDEFEKARPKIFAGMLAALSGAMRAEQKVKLARPPRMADFARWGAAVAIATGHTQREFEQALAENSRRQVEVVVEGNDLVGAIGDAVKKGGGRWRGGAEALLTKLVAGRTHEERRGWPRTASALSHELRKLEVSLQQLGIVLTWERAHGGRRVLVLESPPPPPPARSRRSA